MDKGTKLERRTRHSVVRKGQKSRTAAPKPAYSVVNVRVSTFSANLALTGCFHLFKVRARRTPISVMPWTWSPAYLTYWSRLPRWRIL